MWAFSTPRLQARPVTARDLPVFERLWGDPRVADSLGGVRGRAQVEEALRVAADHWSRHGFGRWLLHDDGAPVGTVKLSRCVVRGAPEVELGYALLPDRWGCGYATEAAAGALAYGRDNAGLLSVVAFALVTNSASVAVMTRLGFEYELDFDLPAGLHALYRHRL